MAIGSGETAHPLWQLLRNPKLYDFVQHVAGADRVRREFVENYVRPRAGDRVLDLGCGTGDLLAFLPAVAYFGIDLNPDYVASAQARYGERGVFQSGDATQFAQLARGLFDRVVAVGLLHHLDDDGVRRLLATAPDVLAPDGMFVSVDPCFDASQGVVQRWMVSKDRGRAVRTPEGYKSLFPPRFTLEHFVRHNWGNIPWSHCVVVASLR